MTTAIMARPSKIPGTRPDINSAPVLTLAIPAYTTMVILGGMIDPKVDDAAVTPTEVPLSYPCFSIAGMKILPTPAVSAWDEPEIPAKIMDTNTFE